ncbi:hypothetical protein [Agromyces bauzanensis]
MNERALAVVAVVMTIGFTGLAAIWMASIGAWGPAVYALVLAAIVVALLISAERHRSHQHRDDVPPHHGSELYFF